MDRTMISKEVAKETLLGSLASFNCSSRVRNITKPPSISMFTLCGDGGLGFLSSCFSCEWFKLYWGSIVLYMLQFKIHGM
jgi:hypothetical protein